MLKAIFTDMDDTLIVNQQLYVEAKAALCGYLRHMGVLAADVMPVLAQYDSDNFKALRYSRARLPLTFEQTLLHFAPGADAEMIAIARDFAEQVFRTVAPVKPGVAEALDFLALHFPVHIVTQGDRSVQEFRVAHLPFRDKLADAHIVDEKSPETFSRLAADLGYKPHEVVMIGDSLKSDIQTAIQAGLHAIWIEPQANAHFEKADLPRERAHVFASFHEAARHITKHGKINRPHDNPRPAFNKKPPRP